MMSDDEHSVTVFEGKGPPEEDRIPIAVACLMVMFAVSVVVVVLAVIL